MAEKFETIDQYIASFPEETQVILNEIRRTIHEVVPEAGEKISYGIPTVTVDGKYLVYFSGWTNHVSVYPIPEAEGSLADELKPYEAGKGTLKFPIKGPIPYDLIGRATARLLEQRSRS